ERAVPEGLRADGVVRGRSGRRAPVGGVERERGFDQPRVRIALWIVAERRRVHGIVFLGEEAKRPGERAERVEELLRIGGAADARPRPDEPGRAEAEAAVDPRGPVVVAVTIDRRRLEKVALDARDGRAEAGIVRRQEAAQSDPERSGVALLAAVGRAETPVRGTRPLREQLERDRRLQL